MQFPIKQPIKQAIKQPIAEWTPLELFRNGENGLWYDIQNLSTLYQDAAGTTPVTAAGERVKLALDTRRSINPADNVLDLDGASGDYASTPDSVAASITGDIAIVAYINPASWTGSNQLILDKRIAGQEAYQFRLDSTGKLSFAAWGSSIVVSVQSTIATGLSGGNWVKVEFDVDNGSGGNDVRFYTSSDPSTALPSSVSWTRLGTTITTAGATNINNTTAPVGVGQSSPGTNPTTGQIYRAQVYNGIDGALAADFNPADKTADGATWVSSTTGETWTQNGNARVVPSWNNFGVQTDNALSPLLQQDANSKWYLDFDGVDDVLTVNPGNLGSGCMVAYVDSGGATILTAQTINGSYNLPTADWYNLVITDYTPSGAAQNTLEQFLLRQAGL